MDISGSYTLYASRERVWNALLDPDLLKRTVPGCELLERANEDTYRLRLNVGVAAVKGVYDGTLRLTELQPYEHYRMIVEGKGARGILHGDGTLTLSERDANSTLVSYKGQAHLGGAIAGVGMRVAGGAANMLIKAYFSKLADTLAAEGAASAASATPASEDVGTSAEQIIPPLDTPIASPTPTPPSDISSDIPTVETAEAIPSPTPEASPVATATRLDTPTPTLTTTPTQPEPTAAAQTSVPAAAAPQRGPLMQLARRSGLTDGTIESEQRWARGIVGGGTAVLAVIIAIIALLLGRGATH